MARLYRHRLADQRYYRAHRHLGSSGGKVLTSLPDRKRIFYSWVGKDDYNEQAVLEQRELTTQQIFAEWEQAHEELKKTIQDMPLDKFPGDLLYPWGDERGSIAHVVEYMIEHNVEHRYEIVKAIEASQAD